MIKVQFLTSLFFITILFSQFSFAQKKLIEGFENKNDWTIFKSDGVEARVFQVTGRTSNAIRFEYDFTKGSGYGGIQKKIYLELTENYQFTFYIRASSPNNNLEIKFLDESGDNVWWMNNRNYTFPTEWTKFTIKKRHINFAWGPTEDKSLKKIYRIEFTIASFSGGKGWIELDDLYFEQLPEESEIKPIPFAKSITEINETKSVKNIFDNDTNTYWLSKKTKEEKIEVDYRINREIGGFIIDWVEENLPDNFDIYLSDDEGLNKVYSVSKLQTNRSYIRLVDAEGKKVLLVLKNQKPKSVGIKELKILEPSYSEDINRFFINIAKDYPRGYFPRYFSEEKSYWNIIGVKSDYKEALINEEGMIEVDKLRFSIEPLISPDNKLITWNNVQLNHSLEEDYLPIPVVEWKHPEIKLQIKSFASGEANKNSTLFVIYKIENKSKKIQQGSLYLLLRPFQVNPYYQFLNINGGVSSISSVDISDNQIKIDSDKFIYPLKKFSNAGAVRFDDGNIISLLFENKFPSARKVIDSLKLASAVIEFKFKLNPGESLEIPLAIPFYEDNVVEKFTDNYSDNLKLVKEQFEKIKNDWKQTSSKVNFNLPESASKIINTIKSNLAYILINRDGPGIQPGSRSYERSWIRDGSLTSSALLKFGIKDEVKEFIEWYSKYQYENGKIPCVVDRRGADPVPEHDSHGEYIFLLKQYFNFTKDTSLLKRYSVNVLKAVEYIKSLIAERSTEHFKNGNDSVRAYYGILPESISHEGYSAKPMHSYWDNFFALRGLKDATEIFKIIGDEREFERIKNLRDEFRTNLYNSLQLAINTRKIDYIPGCVELGDFDATSTTIALYPVNEKNNLPQPYLNNTFDKYFDFFEKRRDGKLDWINYTPYENRIIGSFIFLDQPERAHELIKFFLNDQRPSGWNHWAEVVWKDKRFPGFIGDMPHTWVGSDFINAVRAMFVYENEFDTSLVIGAGLYKEWINSENGISVENLPTYYGNLSYSIKKLDDKFLLKLEGDLELPGGNIILRNFNSDLSPKSVLINGKSSNSFSNNSIMIDQFPAVVEINY